MTSDRINQLIKQVPDCLINQFWLGEKTRQRSPYSHPDFDCDRFYVAYSDTAFGFKFARICADYQLKFPTQLTGDDEILFRAYLYRCNPRKYRDPSVIKAIELTSPQMAGAASKIRALLIPKDSSIEKVSAITGEDPRVLRTYELLFFNILDRKKDALYLNKLVYPEGRIVEYFDRYLEHTDYESIMRRAGFSNGLEEAAFMSGFKNDLVESISSAESAKQLEGRLMAMGLVLMRNGWANQAANVAAITNARQLLAAGKIGGTENNRAQSEFVYMSQVIWDELRSYKQLEMKRAAQMRDGIEVSAIPIAPPETFAQFDRVARAREVTPHQPLPA